MTGNENRYARSRRAASFPFLVLIVIALYGPKFGYLDTSLLAGVLGILLLTLLRARFSWLRLLTVPVCLLVTVETYTLLLYFLTSSNDPQPSLRVLRALIATVLLGVGVSNYPISPQRKLDAIVGAISVNSVAMIIEVLVPRAKSLLANIYQVIPFSSPLRGFGLTAGYDGAGVFCIMGLLIAAVAMFHSRRRRYLAYVVLFFATAFLASRLTMLLALACIVAIGVAFLRRARLATRLAWLAILVAGGFVGLKYVEPLVASSFSVYGRRVETVEAAPAYEQSYADTDLGGVLEKMWFLPHERWGIVFGEGRDPAETDIGYIKLLFMYGLTGALPICGLYVYLFVWIRRWLRRGRSAANLLDARAARVMTKALMVWIPLQLVINVKNLYFLTRGHYELLIIGFVVCSQAASMRIARLVPTKSDWPRSWSVGASWVPREST